MSTKGSALLARHAAIAVSIWLVCAVCARQQVDDAFEQRYAAIDLRRPATAFADHTGVGPSPIGLLAWSGRRPLTARPVTIHEFDTIKLKLASDCADRPVAIAVGDAAAATVRVTREWRQFEVISPAFGRALTLEQTNAPPCAVHLSRISVTNVRGASTGFLEGYLRADSVRYRLLPLTPSSLALGAAPALAYLGLVALSRGRSGRGIRLPLAAVAPGTALLAVLEAARAMSALRIVIPTATFLVVTVGPPAATAVLGRWRELLRLVARLPAAAAAGTRLLARRIRSLPLARQPRRTERSSSLGQLRARSSAVELRELRLPLVLGCALVAAFFAALVGSGLRIPLAPGDGWLQNVPARHLLATELQAGRLPLWNPFLFSGFPLLGDIQVGALYPLHWISAVAPLGSAFNLALMITLVLGTCFTYGLARSFRMAPAAALFAATVYMFSGFALGNLGLTNMVEAMAWLPLVLWMEHRFLTCGRFFHAAMTAVALALQFLAGHPQTTAYTAVVVGLYWLGSLLSRDGAVARTRLIVGGAIVASLFTLLVLPQLVATAELSALSRRVSLTYQEFAGGSLRPAQLVKAVIPYFLSHEAPGATWSLLLGVVACTLALAAWLDRRPGDGAALWGAGLVLGLFMAMAPSWPGIGRALYHVPFLNAFRMPRRWLILVTLAVAMLAGLALSRLLEAARSGSSPKAARRLLVSLAAVVGFAAIAVLLQSGGAEARQKVAASLVHPRNAVAWVAAGGLLLCAVAWRAPRARRAVVSCLFLLQFAELVWFNRHAEWRLVLDLPPSFSEPRPELLEPASRRVLAEATATGERVFTLIEKVDWGLDDVNRSLDAFAPNANLFLGAANLTGYGPLAYRRYLDLTGINPYGGTVTRANAVRWAGARPRLPDVLAARWMVVPSAVRGTLTPAPAVPRRALPFESVIPATPLAFPDATVAQSYLVPAAPGEPLVYRPASPIEVEALYLAGASHSVAEGSTVAEIEARETGGGVHRLPIVVGRETADWKTLPSERARVRPVLTVKTANGDRFLHGVVFSPPGKVRIEELRLLVHTVRGGPEAGIWVPRALALKTPGGVIPLEATEVAGDSSHDFVFVRRSTAMPRVWLAPAAVVVPAKALDAWLLGAPSAGDWDPAEVLLLSGPRGRSTASTPAASRGVAAVERAHPGNVLIRSRSPAPGWVVLSESWYPGWKVRVDRGGWVAPLQAYGLVQAVEVPAGEHLVEFAYRPGSILWSCAGPAAGLLAIGAALSARRRRRTLGPVNLERGLDPAAAAPPVGRPPQ